MTDAFVARQPIFNHKLDVVGYELLFRGGYTDEAATADPGRATATVVLNLLTELDLHRIVGHKPAWVNVSREFVVGGFAEAIPPGLVGLEVPESALGDEEVIAALSDLKRRGYRLALDDFRYRSESHPQLGLFDLVKLNMLELSHEDLTSQVKRLGPHRGMVVAEQLATKPQHAFCVSAGCDLFQGHFYAQPAVVCTRGIAVNRVALLQTVASLQNPDAEFSDIEQLISRDVALSLRLLRYVNSAFFGLRGEVRSIGQALALLGLENVKRWATLSVLAGIDNKPAELTVTALIRARFCELVGDGLPGVRPAELFTLGLFSVIDGMMDAPMHDVVESLPFADDMCEALVYHRGALGRLLDCVVALEDGQPERAELLLPGSSHLYLEALMWGNDASSSLFGGPVRRDTSSHSSTPPRPALATTQSTPPPSAKPAATAVLDPPEIETVAEEEEIIADAIAELDLEPGVPADVPVRQPGPFGRFMARLGRLFGKRSH